MKYKIGGLYHYDSRSIPKEVWEKYSKWSFSHYYDYCEDIVKVVGFEDDSGDLMIKFLLLASTDMPSPSYISMGYGRFREKSLYDVSLRHLNKKDLPLYIGLRYVSPEFERIIREGI